MSYLRIALEHEADEDASRSKDLRVPEALPVQNYEDNHGFH